MFGFRRYGHRRRTPWWVLLLALLGANTLWIKATRNPEASPDTKAKREAFWTKIREARDVWREPSETSDPDASPEP